MTKEKSLYQVKLILECLPKKEYSLIPKDMLEYIENNFEHDDSIIIDPETPIENQKIDDKTYDMLEKILKRISITKDNIEKDSDTVKTENIKLKNIISSLQIEQKKADKAKSLMQEYNDAMKRYKDEIDTLSTEKAYLEDCLNKIPSLVKKIFLRNKNLKLLNK